MSFRGKTISNFNISILLLLYRSIEHLLDSPDNVLLGLNIKWNVIPKHSLYGQVMLDELKLSELFSGNGWWGNKYGIQLGIKSIDFAGVDHLDFQLETNWVRPYTYSHYNLPLAHPLGSNFREWLFTARYKIGHKLYLRGDYLNTVVGKNDDNNYGSDILLVNETRVADFGNDLLQGERRKIHQATLLASFELSYNLFLDLNYILRSESRRNLGNLKTNYLGMAIRYNMAPVKIDY